MNRKQMKRQKYHNQIKSLAREPILLVTIIAILLFLFIFSALPVFRVIWTTIFIEDKFDFSLIAKQLRDSTYWLIFGNSFRLGLTTSILSTIIGFLYAFALTRVNIKGKNYFHLLAMVPIISPPFVISLAMILLFGRNGYITKHLFRIMNNDVYGFNSLVIIQTLSNFPLAYLNIRGILESIDPSVENAAINLGSNSWSVFRRITLPLSLPGILSSLLLVFIRSIEDFSNPSVIGGGYRTLAVEAYMQMTGMYNLRVGAFLAVSLLVPAMTAFIIQRFWISRRSYITVTGKPTSGDMVLKNRTLMVISQIFVTMIALIILILYGSVIWGSFVKLWGINNEFTLANYKYVFSIGGEAVKDTLFLAVVSSIVIGILGMIIAYIVVRKDFIGKKLLEFFAIMPFAVPGTVVGIGYVLSFNQPPILLTGTALIIILAFVTQNLTVGIEAGQNSLRQVDNSIEEASSILGASSFTTFRNISLPLMRPALFTGLVYGFVSAMTSVSAVVFLVSVDWKLMTTSILSQVETSKFGNAAAYCCIMMAMILFVIIVLQVMVNGGKRKKVS